MAEKGVNENAEKVERNDYERKNDLPSDEIRKENVSEEESSDESKNNHYHSIFTFYFFNYLMYYNLKKN